MPLLAKYLHDFARELSADAPALEREFRDIEARKLEIEQKLKAARLAQERASNFVPMLSLDYQCPRCWIAHERAAKLLPIGGGTRQYDKFRCEACNFEYEIDVSS